MPPKLSPRLRGPIERSEIEGVRELRPHSSLRAPPVRLSLLISSVWGPTFEEEDPWQDRFISKSISMIVVPKEKMEGVGWLAYAKDTEDNIFGMIEDTTES